MRAAACCWSPGRRGGARWRRESWGDGDAGVVDDDRRPGLGRGGGGHVRARGQGRGGDRPEVPLGELADGFGVDVAGDDEGGVVRGVVGAVEGHRGVAGEAGDLGLGADGRAGPGAAVVERGQELLVEGPARIAVDDLPALLDDDGAFGEDARLARGEVGHAVGFHAHHQVEAVGGDAHGEGGVVDGGEGAEAAAVLLDGAVELALGELVGGLEHQVFEEVGGAGLSGGVVGGADAVPERLGDGRGALVLDHDDGEAVVEGEAVQAGLGGSAGGGGEEGEKQGDGGKGMAHAGVRPQMGLDASTLRGARGIGVCGRRGRVSGQAPGRPRWR